MLVIKPIITSSFFSTMARKFTSKYIFIDMEMTGLQPETNEIMEVGCVVTTEQLKPLHEGYKAIIHIGDKKLGEMDEWCTKTHQKSGLTDACRNSKLSVKEVETQLISYVRRHSDPKDLLYLAGNSVYMDRLFLRIYMKDFDKLLHYRIIDVSSIKTLCYGWYPNLRHIRKKVGHRALDDIYETLEELQFYRTNVFK